MTHQLLRHQSIGTSFEGTYYVESIFIKKTTTGKDYTDLILRDKSGSRNVKYWGVVSGVVKGNFVFISASVDDYRGTPSIVAKNVEKADEPEDLSNFIPVYDDSDKNAELLDVIRAELTSVEKKTGEITAGYLVEDIMRNSAFFGKFVTAPGSDKPHYGRQGGMLANVVRIADACLKSADYNKLTDIEKSVLVASALLCRVGVIEAYSFENCLPVATKLGILIGCNNLTMAMVASARKRIAATLSKDGKDLNGEIVVRIMHAIAAHDGVSVKPMTKEALILNAAFKHDAEIVEALNFIEADENTSEEFTAWDAAAGRRYYTGVRASTK